MPPVGGRDNTPVRALTAPPALVYAARVPVSPLFHLDIAAVSTDIDDLGHVSNLVYLRWVLEVAQGHSAALGYDMAAYRRLGAVFVVRRHEIDYLSSAYAGDRIRLTTWVESWKAVSSVRMTTISRITGSAEGDGEVAVELARATTLWAMINLDSGKPQRIAAELRQAFADPAA